MEQVASQISIKGIREGLLVTVPDRGSFADLLALLRAELSQKRAFLQGSQVALQVGYRKLNKTDLQALQALFEQNQLELWAVLAEEPAVREAARELVLATRLSGSQTDLNGNFLSQSVEQETAVPGSTLCDKKLPFKSVWLPERRVANASSRAASRTAGSSASTAHNSS